MLEEQKNEAAENEAADKVDEANKSNDVEPGSTVARSKGELHDEKPDINDVPMEESQVIYFYSLLEVFSLLYYAYSDLVAHPYAQ